MENRDTRLTRNEEKEIDLGSMFHLFGRAMKALAESFVTSFLFLFLFLKRRIIWLILATALGFAYGFLKSSSLFSDPQYQASLTARFNYGSSRSLYNHIDYLNTLISQDRQAELARLLNLSEEEAGKLVRFEAAPAGDELDIIELFKEKTERYRYREDTSWLRAISFEQFKNGLTKYELPLQKITVTSAQPDIFPKIQPGLLNAPSSGEAVRQKQEISQKMLADEERIISSSLLGLDTLRLLYNERLRQPAASTEASPLRISGNAQAEPVPELQLYDKVLHLKNELSDLRKDMMENQAIVQVYAPFNPVGQVVPAASHSGFRNALIALAVCLIALIAIEAANALNAYAQKQQKETLAP